MFAAAAVPVTKVTVNINTVFISFGSCASGQGLDGGPGPPLGLPMTAMLTLDTIIHIPEPKSLLKTGVMVPELQ